MQKYFPLLWVGVVGAVLGVFALGFIAVGWNRMPTPSATNEVFLVASFFPLADIAREVAGDRATILQIVPEGADVHDFEPSVRDIAGIVNADIILMTDGQSDAWMRPIIPDALARGAQVVTLHEGEDETHVWLHIPRMQTFVHHLGEILVEQDPVHREEYEQRSDAVFQKLGLLDDRYRTTFATCARHDVFVMHNAFEAWSEQYGITFHAFAQNNAHSELSLYDIKEMIERVHASGGDTLFFSEPPQQEIADIFMHEAHVGVGVLSSLEYRTPSQVTQHASYFSLMEENLMNLSQVLACLM